MPETGSVKWQGRTRGGDFGLRFLLFFVKRFGIRASYALLRAAVPFFMAASPGNCRAIYRYFRRRHGYGRLKALRKTYRNHYLFGQLLFDRFAVIAGRGDSFKVTIEGNELLRQMALQPESIVVAGSHVGNFEIAGYLLSQDLKTINAVVFGGEAAAMQNLRSGVMTGNNIRMVPVAEDMSHIFAINAALSAGEIVSMPCDRAFLGRKRVRRDFMGAGAVFPMGAFLLAERFGSNMAAFFAMKEGGMNYRIFVEPLTREGEKNDADTLQRRYVEVLERMVRRYPEQWYNFYDFWGEDAAGNK